MKKKKKRRRPRLNTNNFIYESKLIHGDLYDYSLTIFITIKLPVIIICSKHGPFPQTPEVHLRGHGCFDCGIEKTISHTISNAQDFINKSIAIHGDLFDYSMVNYKNNHTEVIIICKTHGPFPQVPASHLRGRGCLLCFREIINKEKAHTLQEFIDKSNIVHNNRFTYDHCVYINSLTEVIITCPEHGDFEQLPKTHLRGCIGCRGCYLNNSSKIENKWLDVIGINEINRQKTIKVGEKWFFVDGYDPATNTVYEFYGDYWHGNPKIYEANKINGVNNKTFGDLYIKTLEKEEILKNAGYKIISIWENEFNAQTIYF